MLSWDYRARRGCDQLRPEQAEVLRRLRERLKTCLPEGRYRHSLGVEMAATMLARRHGADEFACACAGLLHDVARDLDAEGLRRLAEEVEGEEVEAADAVLLHGPVGAVLAAREFGIDDPRVLEAIRFHTTGAPGMSLEAKAVCLADFIEPGRSFPGVDRIRELAETDLDLALAEALAGSIKYVSSTKGPTADQAALARSRALVDEIRSSREVGEFTAG